MSFWDTAKRVGLGVATGGLSEAGGARPLLDAASGQGDYFKDLLFGGNATNGIDAQPKQYDAATAMLGQISGTAQQRQAPTIGAMQLAGGPQDQSRQGMMDVANRLGGIANGTQAGAGELAVNRQLSSINAAQNSAARMARGANSALAYRNAMRNQADAGLAGAGQAAQAQMSDQQAANQQLGSIYGMMRGQDIGYASENAQLGQQANLANQNAQLTQQQMNDARQIQAIGQQLGWDQARIQAELQKAGIAMQDKGILPGLLQGAGQAAAAYATGGLSTAAGAAGGGASNYNQAGQLMNTGGLMTLSDERAKTNINDGSSTASAALGALRPITFAYVDPRNGAGRQLGLSAQDLERNPGLAHAVVNTPQGKKVDGGKLATGIAAILPTIDERIRRIESATPMTEMARRDELLRFAGDDRPLPPPLSTTIVDADRARYEALARAEMARRDELLRFAGYGRPPEPPPPPLPTTIVDADRARYEALLRRRPIPLLPPGWVPTHAAPIPMRAMYSTPSGPGASELADMGGQ
jgi:hypothetical protein